MKTQILAILLLATLTACMAAQPEHHGKDCFITKDGSKDCKGVKLAGCHNQKYLHAQVKANHLKHLVCEDKATKPSSKEVQFGLAVRRCKSCKCFLVPSSEKRTCKVLAADAKFVKKICRDQPTLKSLFTASAEAKACVSDPRGATFALRSGKVWAKV